MAYGQYGYKPYGHGAEDTAAPDQKQAQMPTPLKMLRDALERVARGSLKDDPHSRAIEDGVVPGSATAQD